MPVRLPVVTIALVIGLTCGVVAVGVLPGGRRAPSAPTHVGGPPRPITGERYAVEVLHAWDARRAAAWAGGDARALSRLYVPGSPAGAADVALLRRYAARGLLVSELRMQVLSARVLVTRPRRLELEVTDRLARAVAVRADDATAARPLPVDGPTTRRLVLRRHGSEWLMAAVSAVGASGRR